METELLARLVNSYVDVRQQRLDMDKLAKDYKEKENALKADILDEMTRSGMGEIAGVSKRVKLKVKEVAKPTDWQALYDYILKNEAFYLLHKRLSTGVANEMAEQGVDIPGVEFFQQRDLTVSKL